jgi:hypothetical protein
MYNELNKNNMKIDFQNLHELGFVKVRPDEDDKEYFYSVKYIQAHPFLKGLHVIVDTEISVYTYEASSLKSFSRIKPAGPRRFNRNTNDICIYICKKTENNLIAVLEWLEKDRIK